MCRHHGSILFPISSDLVINSLDKQFIKYDICGGGAAGMIHTTYCDFVIIAINILSQQ